MNSKTKKILIMVVFAVMVMPAALGPFCHCYEASPGDQAVLRPVQDHSCCPDSAKLSPNCNLPAIGQAKFTVTSISAAFVFKRDLSEKNITVPKNFSSQSLEFQNHREAPAPLGFHEPLFLSLQVFRL